MEKKAINPWTWQDARGFSQAWRIERFDSIMFVSGQGPFDADGALVGAGDFEAQAKQTFENLVRVLDAGKATLDDVVMLTVYLTDMAMLPTYAQVRRSFIQANHPAATAVEISSLAAPGMMIEIDAVAVQ